MMAPPTIARLFALAACLRRPVTRGWLALSVADAVLILAAFRAEVGGIDPLALAEVLRRELRREVAG